MAERPQRDRAARSFHGARARTVASAPVHPPKKNGGKFKRSVASCFLSHGINHATSIDKKTQVPFWAGHGTKIQCIPDAFRQLWKVDELSLFWLGRIFENSMALGCSSHSLLRGLEVLAKTKHRRHRFCWNQKVLEDSMSSISGRFCYTHI